MKVWFVFTLFLCTACTNSDYLTLVVQSQEDKTVYNEVTHLKAGDTFTIKWIHSVEKTPWRETYQLTDEGELLLIETVFQSFGAGVPHQKGTMTVEDGEVVVRDINEQLSVFRWIHSQNVHFELEMNNTIVFDAEDLPHHERMEIFIEKR
ncbi:DUF1850 domain-containing protein [Halalkalibacter alkalisediminis]|uniref:DUF1850 domain-containing protein n=1 Tax=Halalkalibacter alkalisediminis TaxID=935616 RepID=A0ABV6NDL9_9BACI|nr:DUF1850 domain-containing protein [Halalkalibacter alkalisediminis]